MSLTLNVPVQLPDIEPYVGEGDGLGGTVVFGGCSGIVGRVGACSQAAARVTIAISRTLVTDIRPPGES
jgi:hypothetical protein